MAQRSHLSIGEVLSLLRDEFPDITISKIRFLESQGLVDPERTASGYRKFYDHDIDRLRWVLLQQKEHFLPLRVIKGRLAEAGAAAVPPGGPPASPTAPAPDELSIRDGEAPDAVVDGADRPERDSYTVEELAVAAGTTIAAIEELSGYGLLVTRGSGGASAYFGPEALAVARAAAGFARHGVEARHLRAWRNAADREVLLFGQLVAPLLRQRSPHARQQATLALRQLDALGGELRTALVRQALRHSHF